MAVVELARPESQVREFIDTARAEGERLADFNPDTGSSLIEFRTAYLAWESKTATALETSFRVSGFMSTSPRDEFMGTALSLLDLKISSTTIPRDRVPEVVRDVREKLRVLTSIADRLSLYVAPLAAPEGPNDDPNAPIFLVHGHDLFRREVVRRFLQAVTDRDVIVLAEQPNRGLDLLGKLLANAQRAGFAVVLLTPDDVGGTVESKLSPRARQNVVFELGMFIGLLGRDRVAALNESSVELPTDFSGVAYIPLSGEGWQIELARELKAANIEVHLSRAI